MADFRGNQQFIGEGGELDASQELTVAALDLLPPSATEFVKKTGAYSFDTDPTTVPAHTHVLADITDYVATGSGVSDHGALTGLADDDHLQYHTDARALTWLGTRTTADLSELTNLYYTNERVDDRVSSLIQNGTGITWAYDDNANTLTPTVTITQYTDEMAQDAIGNVVGAGLSYDDITGAISSTITQYTDEKVDDRVAALIQNGTGIAWTYDDILNTLTGNVSITQYTDEMVDDRVATLIQNGTGISWTYSDVNGTLTGDVSITQYTDEKAQDAVGAMIDLTLEYTDVTPLLTRAALTGAITAAAGSNTTALGTFTKALLDGAVSDGNVLYVGDITQYTDELAQDAIGAMVIDTTTINVTYTDATPELKWDVIVQMSVTSDASGLKLSGDAASPGLTKYYGTDGAGTKGFFDFPVGGGGANTALSNLASVAINTTLVSDTDNTDALGTAAIGWSDLFLGSGSLITWSTAPSTPDITLTHSANLLTLAGGDLSLGTTAVLTTGSIELGAASDTTLTRSAGGVLAVEGKNVYMVGGADVAVADGGTGVSSFTQYLLLYADTTTSLSQIAIGTAGQHLTSNGAGVAPSFKDCLNLLKVTGNQTINAGAATFVNITGLTFSVTAGQDYAFFFYITFRSAATTTGWKSGVNHPGGTVDFWAGSQTIANGAAGVATHTERHNVSTDDMTLLTSTVTLGVDLAIRIEGRYLCTSNGTFAARFANELAANTDLVIQKGSWGWWFRVN